MLLSILIPTYNNEKTIAKTIESVLNQDYKDDYEIVVVNNASTDSTLSILKSYSDPKIRLFTNERTVHMYENHNICVEKAHGDYIIFCHSDDELMPDALKILSKKIEERMFPKKYIIWGHSMFRDFSNSILSVEGLSFNMMFSGEPAKQVFLGGGLTPSGTCFSREAMVALGGFPIIENTFDIDWVFEVIAAFNGWEFEMMDRIIFDREYASTYVSNQNEDRLHQITLASEYIMKSLTESQRDEVKKYWCKYQYEHFNTFFMPLPLTKQERLEALLGRYKQSPWKIWKLFKYVFVKWNIWK